MRTSDVVGGSESRRLQLRRQAAGALSLLALVTIVATSGIAQARTVPSRHSNRRAATEVVLKLPTPGDITYGVAQVHITARPRQSHPTKATIFQGDTGGLEIQATSPAWRALRKSTHVYVVVSTVKGAAKNVRDVYFFITRRRGGKAGPRQGTVSFSIPNATPQIHSFWVHGIDRHGHAVVFTSVNAISTAIGNWSRYLGVLKLAHALEAAIHPVDVNGEFRSPGGAGAARRILARAEQAGTASSRHGTEHTTRGAEHTRHGTKHTTRGAMHTRHGTKHTTRGAMHTTRGAKRRAARAKGGIWQGGQHATRDVIGVFHLIFGTIGNRLAFQSAKDSPLVPVFIIKDLNNKPLAGRLMALLAQLPLMIPDKYAAAAQEEQKFAKSPIHAPRISSAQVAIADTTNAASQAAIETPAPPSSGSVSGEQLVVHFIGSGGGTVHKYLQVGPNQYGNYSTDFASGVGCTSLCAGFYADGQHMELIADPATGSAFQAWQGCNAGTGGAQQGTSAADKCYIAVGHGATMNVYVRYEPASNTPNTATLAVSLTGTGSGAVTSAPASISCPLTCGAAFTAGTKVSLQATPSAGSTFVAWSGCDSTSGAACQVAMSADRTVSARFDKAAPAVPPGTLDASFGNGGVALTSVGTNGGDGVDQIVRQSDGKFVVVGTGTDGGGSLVVELARYNSNGTLDIGYGMGGTVTLPQHSGDVLYGPRLAYQPSTGDVIVSGTWESPSNLFALGDFGAVRVTANGTLDTSFGTSGFVDTAVATGGTALSVAVNSSTGEIYIGGSAIPGGGATDTDMAVVAYGAGGAIDTSFGNSGLALTGLTGDSLAINALALDGTSIVGAGSLSSGSGVSIAAMRYTSAGHPDTSFNGGNPSTFGLGSDSYAYSVLVQPTHKIVVGAFGTYSGVGCMALGRFNAGGGQDTSFGSSGDTHVCIGDDSSAYGIAASSDGSYIYATGNSFNNTTTLNKMALARFTADGTLDTGFGTAGYVTSDALGNGKSSLANAVALDGTNPVIAGQAYDSASSTTFFALERFAGS